MGHEVEALPSIRQTSFEVQVLCLWVARHM
jgi:hypothetical protein